MESTTQAGISKAQAATEGALGRIESLLDAGFDRAAAGRLTSAARLTNYTQLVARTVDAFGDEVVASRWLSSRSPDFAGKTPLEAAEQDDYQVRAIEPVLLRLEHGIDF